MSPSDMNPQLGQDFFENNYTSREKSYAFDYSSIDRLLSLVESKREKTCP
jgi:hypothetical protein